MENLKSLKKFQEEGLELSSNEQATIKGGLLPAESSRLSTTSGGSNGDCARSTRQDNPVLQDGGNSQWGTPITMAGVTAANCHF